MNHSVTPTDYYNDYFGAKTMTVKTRLTSSAQSLCFIDYNHTRPVCDVDLKII